MKVNTIAPATSSGGAPPQTGFADNGVHPSGKHHRGRRRQAGIAAAEAAGLTISGHLWVLKGRKNA
jgi:hypothetical protein